MVTKSKDTPLSELTLRKYEPVGERSDRELVRMLCLTLGVLQPGDSRDVITDVLQVLLEADKPLTSKQVEHAVIDARTKAKLPILGVAPSNIRRQLLRLRDIHIIEKKDNKYLIKENSTLISLFEENIERYVLASIIRRTKEYLRAVDNRFLRKQT